MRLAKPAQSRASIPVPRLPEQQAHLEALAGKDTPEEYVMPSLAGLESGGKRGLSRQFHRLMHDAGVDLREVTNPAGRKFAERWFHSLRHTFVSDLANSTSHPEIRRKLTGHKTASAHDLYTHFESETLPGAVHAFHPFQNFEARPKGRSQPAAVSRGECHGRPSPIGDNRLDINPPNRRLMSPQCHPAIPLTTTDLSCRRSVKDLTSRRYAAERMTTHDAFGDDPATPRVLSAYGRVFELKGFSGAMFVSCARFVSEHKTKPSAELYIHDAEKTDESGTSAA